jgi:hypothetical protein
VVGGIPSIVLYCVQLCTRANVVKPGAAGGTHPQQRKIGVRVKLPAKRLAEATLAANFTLTPITCGRRIVGLQIRQNTKAIKATSHHAITDSFNAINNHCVESHLTTKNTKDHQVTPSLLTLGA